MASLRALPFDLFQSVGQFLPPAAIDPLTLTSEHIQRILTPLREKHRGLKDRYGHVICGKAAFHGDFASFLLEILIRPGLCFYVRKLTIEDWHDELELPVAERNCLDTEVFSEIIEASSKKPTVLKESIATLSANDRFLLLLIQLSELRCLRLATRPPDEIAPFSLIESFYAVSRHSSPLTLPSRGRT